MFTFIYFTALSVSSFFRCEKNFPVVPVSFKVGLVGSGFFAGSSMIFHTNDMCRDTFALLKRKCGAKITYEIFKPDSNRKVLFELS